MTVQPSKKTHKPVDAERYAAGQKVTWISVWVNIVLTTMQIIVGIFAHSQALVADAMHTLSDIVADFFVLYANRKGSVAADEDHPYGHGRFETAASLVLGILLIITGVGILVSAVERLANLGSAPPVLQAAMWAALFTLAAKEGLFRYMLKIAERLRSPMLMANAWHARADALSSLVVAAGIAGALFGFTFADSVAAIVVGAMVAKAGGKFAFEAIRELIDTGLSAEEVEEIRTTLRSSPGVRDLHELRTRRMAHQVLVDAHVLVDARISVSEGHRIGELARSRVLAAHPEVLDLLVHVDAEDDQEQVSPPPEFPPRAELVQHLARLLADAPLPILRTQLHYLKDSIEAEVVLDGSVLDGNNSVDALRDRLAAQLPDDSYFSAISLCVQIAPK